MRISRIQIRNFRNFRHLDLRLGQHAVIVGENKIGKSNFIFALRLLLDPTLPDSARQLRLEDFWDGLPKPPPKDATIEISVDLARFENQEDLVALLADHLISGDPMVARLTYSFQPIATLEGDPRTEADYEFLTYGGDRPEDALSFEIRRRIPLIVLEALRDAESDLERWRQSPLRPLLEAASGEIGFEELQAIAAEVERANAFLADQTELRQLATALSTRLEEMVGGAQNLGLTIGFSPTKAERLIRSLRLFIDGGVRGVSEASLGSANLLYLALKTLELRRRIEEKQHSFTLLAIEEPEAHLHPHLQRLIYRDFLRTRTEPAEEAEFGAERTSFVIMTTHSPHVVSVTPVRSLALLKKSDDGTSTVGVSTAATELDEAEADDLERYLDVTRGEIVFAKGVLLVEGMAEEFLIPVFARLLDRDLDRLGITVCAIGGTNFVPYAKFLTALRLPFAVLTDLDPAEEGASLGERRAGRLLSLNSERATIEAAQEAGQLLTLARSNGIFVNSHTLELDLWNSGAARVICDTLLALGASEPARQEIAQWKEDLGNVSTERLLSFVGRLGKGRFAQRLCSKLQAQHCPEYIGQAIEYVADKVN